MNRHSVLLVGCLVSACFVPSAGAPVPGSSPGLVPLALANMPSVAVERIVDGDTIVIRTASGLKKVRLIGVDTPESVHPAKAVQHYGKEATLFLRNLLTGERIYLIHEDGQSRCDRYGRTLAYVYRAPDGLFVNAEIVRQGYGYAYTKFSFKHKDSFIEFERLARQSKKGLWAGGSYDGRISEQQNEGVKAAARNHQALPASRHDQVYVTATGTRYHQSDCHHLRGGSTSILLKDATANGYAPCRNCRPKQTHSLN